MLATLEPSWQTALGDECKKDYIAQLTSFLLSEKQKGHLIYPKEEDIFSAFYHTPFSKVKVVILGQDPYHGENQAHGLSFSVREGKIPPSLINIYKELQTDIAGFKIPHHGNLTAWAKQGVLLLNATLTVQANQPASHQNRGWEIFTDKIIAILSAQKENLVFILWGKFAQQKLRLINQHKHLVLTAAHPSPFSAHNGFFDCKHFSKTNAYLLEKNIIPIKWDL